MEIAVARRVRAARREGLIKRHAYLWERNWTGWRRTLPKLERWGGINAKRGLASLRTPQT